MPRANARIRGHAKSVVGRGHLVAAGGLTDYLRDMMHITSLRNVGGSVMLAVPPAFLDQLHLRPGSTVGLAICEGCLVMDPSYQSTAKPRFLLAELLALSDYTNSPTSDQREWVDAPAVGGELT